MKKPQVSIIIPVFNEEQNIGPLAEEIISVMENVGLPYEIIFVDDGSTDRSFEIIEELANTYEQIRFVRFSRNCGQTAGFDAGIKESLGEIVVTMDGDLQNDPNDIPRLLEYLDRYDVVCGWRVNRRDTFSKRLSSVIANSFRRFFTKDPVHDTGCSLKVYKREFLKKIKLFNGLHRFLPVLLMMEGARICEVPVNHRERKAGKSKYNMWNRLWKGLYDLVAVRWMQKNRLDYEIMERS